jgi:hypothetical protein
MPKNGQKTSKTTAKSRKQQTVKDLAFPINITDIDLSKVWGGQGLATFSQGGTYPPVQYPNNVSGSLGTGLSTVFSTVMCCW